jgi:antitoxin component YwqK of YwqJK toxin-antitoxin module
MQLQVIEGSADLSETAQSTWVFEGVNTIWNDQGKKIAEIYYEKGMLHGDSIYYYPSGQIKKTIPYFQDKIAGTVFFYGEEGNILECIPFENNKMHGKAYAYDQKQNLLYEETFCEGNLQEAKYHLVDKKMQAGVVEGEGTRAEFEDGLLKRLVQYQKGVPEGLVQCLFPDGTLHLSYQQKDGKKHGEEKEYYPGSSQVKILLSWQEDVLQGTTKTWFVDGLQESQRELYQNKKNGPLYAWYKNGDLMLAEEYEKNLLISGTYYKKKDKKPVSQIHNGKGTATLYDPDGYFLRKIPYEKGLPLLEEETP